MQATPSPRSSLEPHAVQAAGGAAWEVTLLAQAPSTNAVASADPRPGTVVVADHQTAGRGRLDRTWETPAGTSLTFSAVVDPGLPDERWPLLPLATALAVAEGVRRVAAVPAQVKWPNDVLVDEHKVAGILLERVSSPDGPVAVIGIGINVGQGADELAVPTATSLFLQGVEVTREDVLAAVLAALDAQLGRLRAEPDGLLEDYRKACSTLGRQVEVTLPGDESLTGTASGIDDAGRLLVDARPVGAGDVVHVRPAGGDPVA